MNTYGLSKGMREGSHPDSNTEQQVCETGLLLINLSSNYAFITNSVYYMYYYVGAYLTTL